MISPLALCALLLSTGISMAQTQSLPRTLSYQGVLAVSGNHPAGTRLLTVSLYGNANGTMKLWQSQMNVAVDSNGVFNCMLGTQDNPLPESAAMDRAIWLGISVDGGSELRPLSEVTASAYALNVVDNAITTNKLMDNSVTSSKIADSSITASKLNLSYVSAISVNGQPTGKNIDIVTGNGLNATWIPSESSLILTGTGKADTGNKTLWIGENNANSDGGPPGNSLYNVVAGGQFDTAAPSTSVAGYASVLGGYKNRARGFYSAIGGGIFNTDSAVGTTIAGGDTNTITSGGNNGAIGGGVGNTVSNGWATIAGGDSNKAISPAATVGGGFHNVSGTSSDTHAKYQTVAGGLGDTASGDDAAIGGGEYNHAYGYESTVAGGSSNQALADRSTVAGGVGNTSSQEGAFVGGGGFGTTGYSINNIADGISAAIVGGEQNHVYGDRSFIGAGGENHIDTLATYSSITGGENNTIDASATLTFVGAGYNNHVWPPRSAIVGGQQNSIHPSADYSIIGGGLSNTIDTFAQYSLIGSGEYNWIKVRDTFANISGGFGNIIDSAAKYSAIGGGRANLAQGPWCVIAGGDSNKIYNVAADHNVITGGLDNIEQNPSYGSIGGGGYNLLDTAAWGSTIAGGYQNTVRSALSAIVGGQQNSIYTGEWTFGAFIGGGRWNKMGNGVDAFLGGGNSNTTFGARTTLVGGQMNHVNAESAFLGGGDTNVINWGSDTSALVGGYRNYIGASRYAMLGAGDSNQINSSNYAFLGGGDSNRISSQSSSYSFLVPPGVTLDSTFSSGYQVLAGGQRNVVRSTLATLGGGYQNILDTNAVLSVLVGGQYDSIRSPFSFIGGGFKNTVAGAAGDVIVGGWNNGIGGKSVETKDIIGGGEGNIISDACWSVLNGGYFNKIFSADNTGKNPTTANYDFLGGGQSNTIDSSEHAVLSGGWLNTITSGGQEAAILGGDHLTAQSYAQVVMGHDNAPQGTSTSGSIQPNDFLVIVGNGTTPGGSDAFEISNNGHSIVHDILANDIPTKAIYGARYVDNTIYAWGDITSAGVNTAVFGCTVVRLGTGTYGVALNNTNGNFSNASVTVTVRDNDTTNSNWMHDPTEWQLKPGIALDSTCGHATATQIGIFVKANEFIIHTYPTGSCDPQDRPFFFKVCGR